MATRMKTLESWLHEGPFTLALSSSFFGFYAHCGAAAALYERGLRPAKLTGSSAGALIGAALGSGLEPEQAREILFAIRREDFWDPGLGPGFLRGRKFHEHVEKYFAPSFQDLKIPLEAAAFDMNERKTKFLKKGRLAPAVVASCAVPLMFHPVKIGPHWYFDGGVFHKSGINAKPDERMLCVYLESQGFSGWYERRLGFPRLNENHRVLRIKNFQRVSFHSLHHGRKAYHELEERMRAALTRPAQEIFLDA